jgi:hypothetical protein
MLEVVVIVNTFAQGSKMCDSMVLVQNGVV